MLRRDNLYRGRNAIHVKRHRKLGKHLTVIKPAVSVINAILSLAEVEKVNLGLIRGTWGSQQCFIVLRPWDAGNKIKLTLAAPGCMQFCTIDLRIPNKFKTITAALHDVAKKENFSVTDHTTHGHA